MDKSPEYVQMCRQAKEIQEQWKKEAGDWIVTPEGIRVLSSKVIQIKGEGIEKILKYAIPKRLTLTSPILDSDPVGALERSIDYVDFEMYPSEYCWWLPRQDQLIKLLGFRSAPIYVLDNISLIIHFAVKGKSRLWKHPLQKEYFEVPSFEQLLLAILMLDRWGKCWNGSDWVAEE